MTAVDVGLLLEAWRHGKLLPSARSRPWHCHLPIAAGTAAHCTADLCAVCRSGGPPRDSATRRAGAAAAARVLHPEGDNFSACSS